MHILLKSIVISYSIIFASCGSHTPRITKPETRDSSSSVSPLQNISSHHQGYILNANILTFIFDPQVYNVPTDKVIVTGTFRDWDQSLDDKKWELIKKGELFKLDIDLNNNLEITPNTQFKFRINDGKWMDPPAMATNIKSGNLVFDPQEIIKSLRAELINETTIIAFVKGVRPLQSTEYVLTNAAGKRIEIAEVLPSNAERTIIIPAQPIDIRRVYYLEIPALDLTTWCSYDGWMRDLYSSKEMGANIQNGKTSIRIFAPRAEEVRLYLYKNREDDEPYDTIHMMMDQQGVWEAFFKIDLHGTYYDFTIHGASDPGNHFYKTTPVHITDPYARVSDNTWGKGRIWHKTTAATPLPQGIPSMENVIAYEVHVQDFTDLLPLPAHHKGTFKGMITPKLENSRGEKIGFDYLVELGINTVHLMPIQEYLHWPDEDWKSSFEMIPI